MKKRIFNLILGMLVVLWISISFLLPPMLGLLSLFLLGSLILIVLFLELSNSLKRNKRKESFSKVIEDPTFRKVSQELKELFDKEEIKEEVIGESNKDNGEVSKLVSKFVGSKEGGKYHLLTCRFAKGIKGESRIEKSTNNYFRKNNYSPCGVCKPDKN